ncbi:hypothetical protein U9M48_022002 [Paspalum notatum var. saurae]|uniref:Uncharacterized protein n=1 Tax=Paspalum notatum var. saurae TaxID=547442 RepID=A0AAQ3TGU8_PASNO
MDARVQSLLPRGALPPIAPALSPTGHRAPSSTSRAGHLLPGRGTAASSASGAQPPTWAASSASGHRPVSLAGHAVPLGSGRRAAFPARIRSDRLPSRPRAASTFPARRFSHAAGLLPNAPLLLARPPPWRGAATLLLGACAVGLLPGLPPPPARPPPLCGAGRLLCADPVSVPATTCLPRRPLAGEGGDTVFLRNTVFLHCAMGSH